MPSHFSVYIYINNIMCVDNAINKNTCSVSLSIYPQFYHFYAYYFYNFLVLKLAYNYVFMVINNFSNFS